jgi:hypothetical protein
VTIRDANGVVGAGDEPDHFLVSGSQDRFDPGSTETPSLRPQCREFKLHAHDIGTARSQRHHRDSASSATLSVSQGLGRLPGSFSRPASGIRETA